MCMDLAGGKTSPGTPLQVWHCLGTWNQQWWLSRGITLRVVEDWTYCLDLAGGKTDNGTPIQLWKCNGLENQKWKFENYVIQSIKDPSKCIDAGSMKEGNYLMIWDCIAGAAQQKFGYDPNMNTIYLQQPTLCLDVSAGKVAQGTKILTWGCDGCWNQQFQVTGPASAVSQGSRKAFFESDVTDNVGACPSKPSPGPGPGPSPGPSPPAQGILPHCEDGNQYGWPKFDNKAALQGSPWAKYFQTVYGGIPNSGYPICTYGFNYVYPSVAAQAGVQLPTNNKACPTKAGEYYDKMSIASGHWIWNPNLSHPSKNGLPSNHWVEIIHTAYSVDGAGTWMYYSPGTAIWTYTGNTRVYTDHGGASKDLLHQPCPDFVNECVMQFGAWYRSMKSHGVHTIQFLKHADMKCDSFPLQGNLAIEIVDVGGSGTHTCGGPGGKTRFRAGWEASHDCDCNNNDKVINCKGFGAAR